MSDVTRILSQIESGDPLAAEKLLPLVYDELRKLAAAKLAHEKPGQTLQATALVHEASLRLMGKEGEATFAGRRHFFAMASESMRRILVDQARRKLSVRHGGKWQRIKDLSDIPGADSDAEETVIVLVEDGHGPDDLLHLIVEIKGYRGQDAVAKAETMKTYWVPGVNHLGTQGRWAFAEFCDVYEIESDFAAKVAGQFDRMIASVAP